MKKLFVAVALVMGLGTSVAFADNFMVVAYAESTIKEAAVEAKEDGTKTYKVVLTDKEGTESTVLFSESGEVLK